MVSTCAHQPPKKGPRAPLAGVNSRGRCLWLCMPWPRVRVPRGMALPSTRLSTGCPKVTYVEGPWTPRESRAFPWPWGDAAAQGSLVALLAAARSGVTLSPVKALQGR